VILDRQSVVPLYYQIQQRLSEQIRSGELKPGELVPSEQEIRRQAGCKPDDGAASAQILMQPRTDIQASEGRERLFRG